MKDLVSGNVFGPKVSCAEVLGPLWPILVIGFVGALVATPIARKLAFRLNILDIPNDTVKIHKRPTAYLGGLAVLAGFLLAMIVGVFFFFPQPMNSFQIRMIIAICGGAVLSAIVGLIDDIKDIRPWQKLLGQAICALFLVWSQITPNLGIIFGQIGWEVPIVVQRVLGFFIVLFFVLGATNSLNLLDGLDGLCTGVTAIITIGFLMLEIHLATWKSFPMVDPIRLMVALSLVGAAVGFLVYNRHPAKIFLGDAGSILLGFIIASMMMMFSLRNPRFWLASIVIFGLPILDTGTALIRRALNHRPLFLSDRGHIYDQMIDRGIPLRQTVVINYLLAAMYAVLGLCSAIFLRASRAIFFDAFIIVMSFIIVGWRGYFRMSGYRGLVQKPTAAEEKKNDACVD